MGKENIEETNGKWRERQKRKLVKEDDGTWVGIDWPDIPSNAESYAKMGLNFEPIKLTNLLNQNTTFTVTEDEQAKNLSS